MFRRLVLAGLAMVAIGAGSVAFAAENLVVIGSDALNLSNDGNYALNCSPGEKICFGAWRASNTVYWGTGMNDKHGCQNCCTTCGHTYETTLNDAGTPQASGENVGELMGALGVIAGALAGQQSSGGGSVHINRIPSGHSNNNSSTITGR